MKNNIKTLVLTLMPIFLTACNVSQNDKYIIIICIVMILFISFVIYMWYISRDKK